MNKEEFLSELDEIIKDKLFIGNSIEDLNNEISNNTWSISMGQELVNQFTIEDLISFFNKVQINRKEQIVNNSKHNMFFYVWFDWQSARLRFNLISDFHKKLPFRGEYKVIENIEPILNEFLNFLYHDGFPIEEVNNNEIIEEEIEINPLNVYLVILTQD